MRRVAFRRSVLARMRKALACVAVILGFAGITLGLSSTAGADTSYYEYAYVPSDVSIGTSVTDTFSVYQSGVWNTQAALTGTLTYSVYGPSSSSTCPAADSLGSPVTSQSIPLNGQVAPVSNPFNALTTGDFFWTITFASTDGAIPSAYSCNVEDVQGYAYAYNSLSGAGGCNLPLSVTDGTAVTDTAVVYGDSTHPVTGTVYYYVYPWANPDIRAVLVDRTSPSISRSKSRLRCHPVLTCLHRASRR